MACHMWQISWYRNCDFPIRKVLTFFNKFTHLSKCHGNLNTRPVINKNFNHSHRMKIVPCQKCILHTWHVTCHRQCWWNHWLCYNFLSKLLSVPPLPLNASSLPPHVNLLSCDSCFSHSWLMDSLRLILLPCSILNYDSCLPCQLINDDSLFTCDSHLFMTHLFSINTLD